MSELRVTGGYEPNDPVVMSQEEYHDAIAQARREGVEAMRPYATHQSKCELRRSGDRCDCGLARLLSEKEKGVRINERMRELQSWGHDGPGPCELCKEYAALKACLLSEKEGA